MPALQELCSYLFFTQELVHFVNRDSLGLANDFLSLGFLPDGVDIQSVSEALQASFGDGTRQSQDFQGIMNQLWNRLETDCSNISAGLKQKEKLRRVILIHWGSFDIRAVVSATEDLFQFILSDKGSRVRVFLVRDIVKAADEHGVLVRWRGGFHSLGRAVKLAPDLWSAMLIRMMVKPEFQKFAQT
ncbi:hypothetical protein HAX54_047530 [Datura stramonium]|uniref:Uncharacterized protein n=1 Tax=Datura stramonium TaxID=4076 RepID=A0ABS8SSJ6_DATST|nr:hypothetical protein [Datura stramonium]